MAPRWVQSATIASVGLVCKAFLHSRLCSISVTGLSNLLHALEDTQRKKDGRGVITGAFITTSAGKAIDPFPVSNHISTLDDPVAWGVLPPSVLRAERMRWALGAADVCFTNPAFSAFFRAGQVLETFRGNPRTYGIYQPSVNTAIDKLDQGGWVHLFGEGKINQPATYPRKKDVSSLHRFKWGVGRVVMDARVTPLVIPMWITGFNDLMPEGRKFPWKYIPKTGVNLSVNFGEPIPLEDIDAVLHAPLDYEKLELYKKDGYSEVDLIRSNVTYLLQQSVEGLGRRISGNLLGSPLNQHLDA